MNIPKIAHRIWFGPFPDKYKKYLQDLAKLNPDYVTKLWSDPSTMPKEDYLKLEGFCKEHKIQLCNIREHKELANHNLILKELDASKVNDGYQRLHYVRASDIARISILLKEGGIYTDTDSIMKKSFPEFQAKHDILFKIFGEPFRKLCFNFFKVFAPKRKEKYYFPHILYDFIACSPQHELLKLTASITQRDYNTYESSRNRQWESSKNTYVLTHGTVKLTGTTLKWALNHSYQTAQLSLDDPNELFFNADDIMEARYDKAWLQGFDPKHPEDKSESTSLDNFCSEIDEHRKLDYPLHNHGEHPDLREELTSSFGFLPRKTFTPKLEIDKRVIPEFKFHQLAIPEFKLDKFVALELKINLDAVSKKLLTRDEICKTYAKNSGSLLKQFSIFRFHKNKSPEELIKELQKRAQNNKKPDSASRRTLIELGIKFDAETPTLKKQS